jgi:hypothetical protein
MRNTLNCGGSLHDITREVLDEDVPQRHDEQSISERGPGTGTDFTGNAAIQD